MVAEFIGSHLAETLTRSGAKVKIVDDLSAGKLQNIQEFIDVVEFQEGDIRQMSFVLECMDEAEIIFHLAANASVPHSVADPRDDFSRNVNGTFNILDGARQRGVQSVVFASSGAVYGQPNRFPIQETDPIQPISPYGASKAAAEAICHAFSACYGLSIKIARIFNTYGPRQPRFVMYDFYRKLRQNPSVLEILGDGQQVRDYCYVADTIDALMRLGMCSSPGCEAFNIASGKSYSVIDVANILLNIIGLRNVDFYFTGSSWLGDAQRWEVSIEKIRAFTGFDPKFDLKIGLRLFAEWFDAHPERVV